MGRCAAVSLPLKDFFLAQTRISILVCPSTNPYVSTGETSVYLHTYRIICTPIAHRPQSATAARLKWPFLPARVRWAEQVTSGVPARWGSFPRTRPCPGTLPGCIMRGSSRTDPRTTLRRSWRARPTPCGLWRNGWRPSGKQPSDRILPFLDGWRGTSDRLGVRVAEYKARSGCYFQFSSEHPNVVNFAKADGSVSVISYQVTPPPRCGHFPGCAMAFP
ncbi:MAG: DUF1559 domain-containing protein [Planctomycetes bacterium]|nr:DUF1559 domain-containing protein [Planctomycetota bacterium]